MKIGKFLLAGIIALGMMACNNEDAPVVNQAEATVSVKIVPSSNGPAVKATGNLSGNGVLAAGLAAESAIKSLEVFIFNSITDTSDGYGIATSTTDVKEVLNIATHPGKKVIMIVANAGTAIGSVTNKTALLAKTKDLPVVVATSGLPMTGESAEITLDPGDNQYGFSATDASYKAAAKQHAAAAPLQIQRVNARVAIVSANIGTLPADQLAIFDNLKDVEVAMFNVPKASKLFGPAGTLATNADYLFGESWPSTSGSYAVGTAEGSFKDASVTFPIVNTTAPYYYVAENTSTVAKEQMLIVLRGKPHKGTNPVTSVGLYTDANGYTYYPVWVNAPGHTYTGNDTGDSKIRRNTQYNISLTINKIGNPTIDPVQDAFLDVKVEVLPWLVVTQGVVW